jgi:hypothetical protein
MTLDDLLVDCCTRLNYAPDLAAVEAKVKARLTAFLNQTQTEILGQPSYKRLQRIATPLRTIGGVHEYGLPGYVERIVAIVDRVHQWRLNVMTTDAYRRYVPDPDATTGTPTAYAFDGWGALQFQPDPTEDLYVYSGNVLDDGAILSGRAVFPSPTVGAPNSEVLLPISATLANGATGVALAPAPVLYVYDLALDRPSQGAVDLLANQPPTRLLARLQLGHRRFRFPTVYLVPTPSGEMDFDVFGERTITPLVESSDEPSLPPRFHFVLAAGARMKEYELRGDSPRLAVASREYATGLSYLNAWVSDQPDAGDYTVPDDGRVTHSVLGPWFPPSGYRRW